ncbi:hypothetical protein [Mucilaginibacter sp.]|uniref:hypothetical protein n=1 Tax=Mucilaginibacter sp. TaxID=1882438 RepID=UPI003D0AE1FE
MTNYTRIFILFLLTVSASGAMAQSAATTSSPYSRYGLGDYDPALMPQTRAMGSIATAINRISGYNNINVLNPASYGAINLTTIDVGIYSNVVSLSQSGQTGSTNANFRLSHVAFAIPVTHKSALSFGLLPYTEMGYNYKQTLKTGYGTGSPVDTNAVNYVYQGDGGLSKAYLGYGFGLGKHLLIGANISYIFGNLIQTSSTEIPSLYGTLNSRVQSSNSINGFNYDYGVQYSFDFTEFKHLVLGYSASTASSLNNTNTYIVSQYTYDSSGNENVAADSVISRTGTKTKIKLPQINHFGVSYQSDGKFLLGADYTIGNWSSLTISGANAGFQNSKTVNVGGQITPNSSSTHNYFARVDYRFGAIYDDTYLSLNNTTIKKYALTFGFGLPLAPSQNLTSFYKINFSAELGQRGTLTNGLVKENYVNLHLGFTLNDKWFQKYKFE